MSAVSKQPHMMEEKHETQNVHTRFLAGRYESCWEHKLTYLGKGYSKNCFTDYLSLAKEGGIKAMKKIILIASLITLAFIVSSPCYSVEPGILITNVDTCNYLDEPCIESQVRQLIYYYVYTVLLLSAVFFSLERFCLQTAKEG